MCCWRRPLSGHRVSNLQNRLSPREIGDTHPPTLRYRQKRIHTPKDTEKHTIRNSHQYRDTQGLREFDPWSDNPPPRIYKQLEYGLECGSDGEKWRSAERRCCLERGTLIWKWVGAWSAIICRSAERWKKKARSAERQSKNRPERGALETPGRAPK